MGISIAVFIMTFIGGISAISSDDTLTNVVKYKAEAITAECSVSTKQSVTTAKCTERPKIITTATVGKAAKHTKSVTTAASINSIYESTSTTTATYPFAIAKNPTVSAVSVSCIKVEWENDNKHSYSILATTEAPYAENIRYVFPKAMFVT